MDPNSPIASASRRVKKIPKDKASGSTESKDLNFGYDILPPKRLDFRRHSVSSSTSLMKAQGTIALFSPTYRGSKTGGKKVLKTKKRAKSVFVLSPMAKNKNLKPQYPEEEEGTQAPVLPLSTDLLAELETQSASTSYLGLPVDDEKKDGVKKDSVKKDSVKKDCVKKDDDKKDDEKEDNDKDHPPKKNYDEGDNDDDYYDEGDEYDYEEAFDPFIFIKNLPPLSKEMKMRKSPVPKKKSNAPKITLALDLDETLVHCSVTQIDNPEITFPVEFNGIEYTVYVRTRPHLKLFLETVSEWFELILFTASQPVYANKLMDILDPGRKYIPYRIFRDSCVCTDGNYLKDLHILGRDLQYTAIVDNSVQAFGYQLNNGIPIESWFEDPNDIELKKMIDFLKILKDAEDVRPIIRDAFHIEEFVNSL